MDTLIMAAQLILGLTILVGVHELGHLLTAKFFGMRVDQFSIGFPPKIWGKKFGDTVYSIGAIPLGGYVKIVGMVDESMDLEHLKKAPEPYEFRSKPAWQRLIVMLGGIIVNVIVGILIFIGLTFSQGEEYIPASAIQYGIVAHPLAEEIGLKTGDKIIQVNGKSFDRYNDLLSSDVLLEHDSYYTVLRGEQEIKVPIPNNLIEKLSENKDINAFIEPIYPFSVAGVVDGSPAQKAGLKSGDRIVALDGVSTPYFHILQDELKKKAGKSTQITIKRNLELIQTTAQVGPDAKLGFMVDRLLKTSTQKFGLGESIQKGSVMAFTIITVQIKAFKKMFEGDIDIRKSLSGPIGIAKEFGGTWNWVRFWNLTGLLSMVLAFMNLLPIPALDGGHVMFLSYEMISGRKPSDRFLEIAQKIGMFLLLGLTAFTILNDVSKLFGF